MSRPVVWWSLIAAIVAALLFLPMASHADESDPWIGKAYEGETGATVEEYTVTGLVWDHRCLTHNGDTQLEALYVRAFLLWTTYANIFDCGSVAPGSEDIDFHVGPLPAGVAGQAAWGFSTGTGKAHCSITISPGAVGNFAVMAHELGHCLGVGHSQRSDQLMSPYCCNPIGDDDIAAIRSIYGANPNPPVTPVPPTEEPPTPLPPTPTPTLQGCASSYRTLPDGTVVIVVTCEPFHYRVPVLARD